MSDYGKYLAHACLLGDVNFVREILAMGEDPNVMDAHNQHPLTNAIENDNIEIVKMLLKAGADPCESMGTITAVVESGEFEMLKALLEGGMNPTGADPWYRTIIHSAFSSGSLPKVKLLLKHGMELFPPTLKEPDYFCLLSIAVNGNHVDLAKLVIDTGKDAKNARNISNFKLIYNNNIEMLQLLLDNGYVIPSLSSREISMLLEDKRRQMLIMVLQGEIDLNTKSDIVSYTMVHDIRTGYHFYERLQWPNVVTLSDDTGGNITNGIVFVHMLYRFDHENEGPRTCHRWLIELLIDNGADLGLLLKGDFCDTIFEITDDDRKIITNYFTSLEKICIKTIYNNKVDTSSLPPLL